MIAFIFKIWWYFKSQIFYRFLVKNIGFKSYVGSFLFVYGAKSITLCDRVRIFPGCRMECHDNGTIFIENDVSIGQNFHITSGGGLCLKIGAHTTISGNTFITNIDHDYKRIGQHIMKQAHICNETTIGENCFIGYGVAILAGTKLGKQCVVGANSVVRGDFPDYSVIVGAPARIVKRYDANQNRWRKSDAQGNFLSK